jgi:acyl carrier protein
MDIDSKVIEVVANQLGKDKSVVTQASRLNEDLGADSLDTMELVMALEDEFHVTVPDEVLKSGQIKTVGDISTFVATAKK